MNDQFLTPPPFPIADVVYGRPLWRKNYFNELQKLIKHVLRMTNDGMYLAEGHGYLCGIPSTGIYKITAVVGNVHFLQQLGTFFQMCRENVFGHADCSEGSRLLKILLV